MRKIIKLKKGNQKQKKWHKVCIIVISVCAICHSCVIESFRVHEGFIHFSR